MEPNFPLFRWVPAVIALAGFAVLSAANAQPTSASAGQSWPSKPIKVIVDLPPGSTSDLNTRTIAVPLQQALGQPVVVENRSGANGMIGANALDPDAHSREVFTFHRPDELVRLAKLDRQLRAGLRSLTQNAASRCERSGYWGSVKQNVIL
jgi:tripartite-type tricarboxylate transporter receptor subunit TctC